MKLRSRSWVVLGWSGRSWCDLGVVLGVLGWPWIDLGWSWGDLGVILERPGAVLGCPGRLLGGSWGALGRSKIDQKIDPKLDAKTGRIATEKNGPNTTPVVVSEPDTPQRDSDNATQKNYQNRYRYD